MKCQILFFGNIRKHITNLSSAESAHRVVSVKVSQYLGKIYTNNLIFLSFAFQGCIS